MDGLMAVKYYFAIFVRSSTKITFLLPTDDEKSEGGNDKLL